jgi:hypothetical protein
MALRRTKRLSASSCNGGMPPGVELHLKHNCNFERGGDE